MLYPVLKLCLDACFGLDCSNFGCLFGLVHSFLSIVCVDVYILCCRWYILHVFLFICLFCLNSDQLIYVLNDLLIDRLIDLCVYLATFFAAFIFTVAIYMLSVNVLIYLSHCVSVLVRT